MALIERGCKRYLIRSVRMGGRVTSRCVATGERAVELDAAFRSLSRRRPDGYEVWERDRERRRENRALLEARKSADAARERDEALEARVEGLAGEARGLAGEAMRAGGFHQHRWTWRRKRGTDMKANHPAVAALMEQVGLPSPSRASGAETESLAATIDRWEAHDAGRAEGEGSVVELTAKVFGADPSKEVVELLIARWSSLDIPRELLRRQYARMLAELLGPEPTAIEVHLAERVMVCWLDVQIADRRAIELGDSATSSQKARDRSHRRYLGTLRSLATVRSKALPGLRLSLAIRDGRGGSTAAAMVESGPGRDGDDRSRIDTTSGRATA